MPSNEENMLEALKNDTTKALKKFMSSSPENYKMAIEYFSLAQSIELRREDFGIVINGQKYYIGYKFVFLSVVLHAASKSIEEILITNAPCDCSLDTVIFHLINKEKKLRQVTFHDNLPIKHLRWMRRHTGAKFIFPVINLYEITKCSTDKTLTFACVEFPELFVPFKDLSSFQSIKALEINGYFKEKHLRAANHQLQKLVQFINGFPSLSKVDVTFYLDKDDKERYDGFTFYEIMKKIEKNMYKGLSPKLAGSIAFVAFVSHGLEMSNNIKKDLYWSALMDPPVEHDELNNVVRRNYNLHPKLYACFLLFTKRSQRWIDRNTEEKSTIAVTKLSELVKTSSSSDDKTLVFHPVAFVTLLSPFKDFNLFQSVKKIEINGTFKEKNLQEANNEKFVQFIKAFPSLTYIDASFALNDISPENYDGSTFYDLMKDIDVKMFKSLSPKLRGTIHFGASVTRFESMSDSIKRDLYWSKQMDPPVKYDVQNSIIQRNFKIHDGLTVEFSLYSIFSDLK